MDLSKITADLPFGEELPALSGTGTVTIKVTAKCGGCDFVQSFVTEGTSGQNRIGKTLRDQGWAYYSKKAGWVCCGCKTFLDSVRK